MKCSFDGCEKEARSRGYCQTHYMRIHRHGTVNAGRSETYGTKASHPLYVTHKAAKAEGKLCEPWLDFWAFVADVSPIPEGNFRLCRIDKALPYSKENCEWRESVIERKQGESKKEFDIRRRKLYPQTKDQLRQKSLKQNHGMTVAQYEQLLSEQNGVCAICGKVETKTGGVNNVPLPLCVDHCHKTRKGGSSNGVRGLLCQACNIGLGKFDDEPELLRKAAAYIERYRS